MRAPVTPSVLFATFVAVCTIAGLGLSVLEGAVERHPALGLVVILSFFLAFPILIAAAVAVWREVPEQSFQHHAPRSWGPLVSPTTMFTFGVFALLVSLAFERTAHSTPLSLAGTLLAVLEAAAIPSLVASFVWVVVLWAKQRGR